MSDPVTQELKRALWARFGSEEHPAEWDGRVYGGGKLSQRYWEYYKAVELLDLDEGSVVLDIGGGSPVTGAGFFASLLATRAARVLVMDPNVNLRAPVSPGVEFIVEDADEENLARVFERHPEITHVASISVLEHIDPEVRKGILRAINRAFRGERVVLTFEYHPTHCFFEGQLTGRTASEMVSAFDRFYPDAWEASPTHGEAAVTPTLHYYLEKEPRSRFLKIPGVRWRLTRLLNRLRPRHLPLWYPVALRFRRD